MQWEDKLVEEELYLEAAVSLPQWRGPLRARLSVSTQGLSSRAAAGALGVQTASAPGRRTTCGPRTRRGPEREVYLFIKTHRIPQRSGKRSRRSRARC